MAEISAVPPDSRRLTNRYIRNNGVAFIIKRLNIFLYNNIYINEGENEGKIHLCHLDS